MAKKRKIPLGLIILIVFLGFIAVCFISCSITLFADSQPSGNIALISIDGAITVANADGLFYQGTSSTRIVKLIEKADSNPSIQAILFEINSPGGSAVASKEIGDAIKRTKKPTYSLIREFGTSGGYWVASATDTIIANDLSVVGSIGVLSFYLEISGLLEKYNITYQSFTAGEHKDIGVPFKKPTERSKAIMEKYTRNLHTYFINEVAENRGMKKEDVRKLATGEFFLGLDGLELGLVDVLGDKETAINLIKKDLNLEKIKIAEYRKTRTLKDVLGGVLSKQFFFIGKGIGSSLVDANIYNNLKVVI